MVTIYDMASGAIRKASETDNTGQDVSLDQAQNTEQYEQPLHVEEQLALREHEYLEAKQDYADKIPPELASVDTDTFIGDMEK
jgi:hypothetical protein